MITITTCTHARNFELTKQEHECMWSRALLWKNICSDEWVSSVDPVPFWCAAAVAWTVLLMWSGKALPLLETY